MLLIMIPDQYLNYYKVLEICTGYFDSLDIMIPGLSDQCPWASIRKMKFSEEQCWRQIEALGFYLAVIIIAVYL